MLNGRVEGASGAQFGAVREGKRMAESAAGPTNEITVPLDVSGIEALAAEHGRLNLRIGGLPPQVRLTAGDRQDDGSWLVAPEGWPGLSLVAPPDVPDFDLEMMPEPADDPGPVAPQSPDLPARETAAPTGIDEATAAGPASTPDSGRGADPATQPPAPPASTPDPAGTAPAPTAETTDWAGADAAPSTADAPPMAQPTALDTSSAPADPPQSGLETPSGTAAPAAAPEAAPSEAASADATAMVTQPQRWPEPTATPLDGWGPVGGGPAAGHGAPVPRRESWIDAVDD